MKIAEIPNTWILEEGLRLDPRPYVGGAMRLRKRVLELPHSRLDTVTVGFRGGIFTHLFSPKRTYVSDREYGVPFLGASSMLQADLSDLLLLSNRDAESHSYKPLKIRKGMTLISCSGSVGRMTYARASMDGMASAGDLLKIQPDPEKIPPGYLYAFFRSEVGAALVSGGTYGTIVQHLERQHVANIPVPRLGKRIEAAVHKLIDEAASQRDEAAASRREAILRVHGLLGWTGSPLMNVTPAESSALQRRLDAFHHTQRVVRAREALGRRAAVCLGDKVESVFEPNRGPRMKVDDTAFGVPFLSSSEVFRLDPTGEYSISKQRTPHLDRLLVSERDLLLPRSGQLGGIIGRAVLPLPTYYGHAASEHLVRVRCNSKDDAFFLWSVFASEPGYLATIGTAFGSSIPSLDCELIGQMKVPWFDEGKRLELSKRVAASVEANTRAIHAERKAVRIVEGAIERGVTN